MMSIPVSIFLILTCVLVTFGIREWLPKIQQVVRNMDTSSAVASWLSFAVTAAGLGGLISQAGAIYDKLDPFHATRKAEYLGIWFQRQPAFPWWRISKPPPEGPAITGKLSGGFCGKNTLCVARVPRDLRNYNGLTAGWSIILDVITPGNPSVSDYRRNVITENMVEGQSSKKTSFNHAEVADFGHLDWDSLPLRPLIRQKSHACVTISRTTLITMLCITNAKAVFRYSDAAGLRAGYAGYNGQWYLHWKIGEEAMVRFASHDSHSSATDVYPRTFRQRVDRCVQMLCGIIYGHRPGLKVAFCGRKPPGTYRLEHVSKGFPGAHGSRHLYNMMGGKVYEVDFMAAVAQPTTASRVQKPEDVIPQRLVLDLPSTEKGARVHMIISPHEEEVIKHTLDLLPWNSISWSMHRGMKDILVTYARPVMNAHRERLAELLKKKVADCPHVFEARGWEGQFVRSSMGDMAASAVLTGGGDSGDLVRVVTDIVLAMAQDWDLSQLDEVDFWRRPVQAQGDHGLELQAVVALTKVFVLEWSYEVDYQMYHDLPISLYFG